MTSNLRLALSAWAREARLGLAWLAGLALVAAAVAIWLSPSSRGPELLPGFRIADVSVFASLTTFAIGTYAIWPSRWNIPAHLQVGFCVSAYLVPAIFVGTVGEAPVRVAHEYTEILAYGAVAFALGLLVGGAIGGRLGRVGGGRPRASFDAGRIARPVALMLGLGILCLAGSMLYMGFAPAFAADPLAAKFFKGPYQERYLPVAIPFRGSFSVVAALLPLSLVLAVFARRWVFLVLGVAALATMALTLQRSPAFTGLFTFVAIVVAARGGRRWFAGFLVVVAVLIPLGSAAYAIGADIFGLGNYSSFSSPGDPLRAIADGSPDVADGLSFVKRFEEDDVDYTYGRTFVGGLVPGRYEWNPSIYTLGVTSPGADVDDVVSGGLRLPVAIWGFVAFGWAGVLAIAFLAGSIAGALAALARRHVGRHGVVTSAVLLLLYSTLGAQLAAFYLLSIHTLPAIAAAVLVSAAFLGLLPARVLGKLAPGRAAPATR